MGLHDRLKTSNGSSRLSATAELLSGGQPRESSADSTAQDPYAELKTRIHHACIATLGAELFKREATGDLNERVTRAVTEQLVLDRTRAGRLAAFEQPLRLVGRSESIPSSYIRCLRSDVPLEPILERVRTAGWPILEIDTHHDAQIGDPEGLARLLSAAASSS